MTEERDREAFDPARLLGSLGQAVIATDADGVVRYWNAAAQRLYGWAAEEAVGVHLRELIARDTPGSFAAEVMAALRSGGQWSGGREVRRKDNSWFPVLVTNTVLHDGQGRLVGLLAVSTELGSAVRPFLARFSGATFVVAADAIVRFWSPMAMTLLGWHEAELVGTSALELIHPEDLDLTRLRFIGSPVAVSGPEFRLRARDGRWCWVDARMTDLRDDPAVAGVIVALRDVSERREAQDQVHALAEQLQAALGSRAVIEQAKGVLADRLGTDIEQAFEWLRTRAHTHHRRIDEVAGEVIAGLTTGRAPDGSMS